MARWWLLAVAVAALGAEEETTCNLRLRSVFGPERTDRAISRYDGWLSLSAGNHRRLLLAEENGTAVHHDDDDEEEEEEEEGRRLLAPKKRRGPHKPMPWVEMRPGAFLRQSPILSSVPLVDLCPPDRLAAIGEAHEAKKFCGVEALQDAACAVVSVGCNGQWQFETQVVAATTCNIDVFDCTGTWAVPRPLEGRVRLHPICLGDRDGQGPGGRRFLMWASAMNFIGATRVDWLKIDCEGCEHTVLPQMLRAASTGKIPLPEHVSVEVHFGPADITTKPTRQIRDSFPAGRSLFQQLYALGGYFLISRLDLRAAYPAGAGCSEFVLARASCGKKKLHARPAVALYDPSRDWLDPAEAACLEVTSHAPWRCLPWASNQPRCEKGRGPDWAPCPNQPPQRRGPGRRS